jgi:hypothetical protein
MKLPGQAWLQFEVDSTKDKPVVCQTAIFKPRGLWGLLYWYGSYPLHWFVFKGMIKGLLKSILP